MEATKFQRQNNFKIIGRLIKADVKLGTSAMSGQAYASVKSIVQSNINGETFEYEIDFYSAQLTSQGKPSALYTSYAKMADLEGKKVEISGYLRENRYFSNKLNQMSSAQELAGRFIKGVPESVSDESTWELSGFIAKTLTEKINKKGEVYRYDLALAQSNYGGNSISMFTLHIDPSRRDIVGAVSGYEVGQTIQLNGTLNFKVETVTSESKSEGGFGTGVTRTYTNRQKNFFITGGSAAIKDETAYDSATISDLVSNYKARDVELSEKAQSRTSAAEVTPTVTKKQTSLI